MDLQRYLLIAAIAVLSFMLLTEWNQFQQTQRSTARTENYQAQQLPAATDVLPGDAAAQATDDLPAPDGSVPQLTPTPAAGSEIVRVRTNTLELQIDLRGGDVVFAALPQHLADPDNETVPFVLLEQNNQRTYIAQSGLIGPDGTDKSGARTPFQAAANDYVLQPGERQLQVDLRHTTDEGIVITKRFTLERDSYLVNVEYLIDNRTDSPWQAAMFTQLKRDGSADPSATGGTFGIQPFLGASTSLPDSPYQKLPFDEFADEPLKLERQGGWIAMVQHYFLSAWIPGAEQVNRYATVATRDGSYIARAISPTQRVAAGEQGTLGAQLYLGPKDQYRLQEIATGLDLTVDYGILWWIAQPLFWLLTKIHSVLGNWGWSIVGLTVLVKMAFFGLNAKAYRSMANMRRVQPKIMALRERFPDDRQKQSQEMMTLYKTEKINPLGGCLPILVQMPVFLALYWVLLESVELRHAPWILWIEDLSAMDPYFILPLLMGVSMFFQQKLNPPPPDPTQAKIMQLLPIVFTFFFLWFPAGLVLYWVVNNVLSIAQQYVITKRIEASEPSR